MSWELLLAVMALLISGSAAVYAHQSAREARKANDIGRLNALLALRIHYLALMQRETDFAQLMPNPSVGLQRTQNRYADLAEKLREVDREIEKYHVSIVGQPTSQESRA
jgi:hypothetical protein